MKTIIGYWLGVLLLDIGLSLLTFGHIWSIVGMASVNFGVFIMIRSMINDQSNNNK